MCSTTFCAPMSDVSDFSWGQTIFCEILCKNGTFSTFLCVSCEKIHLVLFRMRDGFISALVTPSIGLTRLSHSKQCQMHIFIQIQINYRQALYNCKTIMSDFKLCEAFHWLIQFLRGIIWMWKYTHSSKD
jgi:hypothetical protein